MLVKLATGMFYSYLFLFFGFEAFAGFSVRPAAETQPVDHNGDAIDDPAVWIHPSKPEKSLILGTDKQKGINVYSLSGKLQSSYTKNRFNNIDIRYNFSFKGKTIDLIAATRHDTSLVEFFTIDAKQKKLVSLDYKIKPTVDAYGLCLYKSYQSGTFHLFVTSRNRDAQQFKIIGGQEGISHVLERTLPIPSKNEGCVADDELGNVYIAEEHRGIWKFDTDARKPLAATLIGSISERSELAEDIEGLALYIGNNGEGYLLASVQGLDSFAIFDRKTDTYLDSFKIEGFESIDGVSHTDGIELINTSFGSSYHNGLMIAQDDVDRGPSFRGTQNFKMVSWKNVSNASTIPLIVNSDWDPRH